MADTIDHDKAKETAAYDGREFVSMEDRENLYRAYLDLRRRLDEALALPAFDEVQQTTDMMLPDWSYERAVQTLAARKSRLAIKEGKR